MDAVKVYRLDLSTGEIMALMLAWGISGGLLLKDRTLFLVVAHVFEYFAEKGGENFGAESLSDKLKAFLDDEELSAELRALGRKAANVL